VALTNSWRAKTFLRPGRGLVLLVITLALAGVVSSCGGPDLSPVTFEGRNAEGYARLLLSEYRFDEAAAFLRAELEGMPEGAQRLSLLLLLADAQISIGDVDAATATLAEADTQKVGGAGKKAIAARESRLAQLRGLKMPPDISGVAPDSAASPADTALASPMDTTFMVEDEVEQEEHLISNSFFETDLRQVLTDLSMETGVPIIWDNTVQGLVTFEAIDQPLEDVLRSILLPAGYVYSLQKGTYFVGSPNPQDAAFGLLSTTEVISLSNIDATEAIRLLSDFFEPYVKASMIDNAVCITAPPSIVERVRSDLAQIDSPPTQILIEVVVSEISTSALRQIGLDWSFLGTGDDREFNVIVDNTDIEDVPVIAEFRRFGATVGNYSVDLAASLEALVQSGDARIRANPRIAALNGRTAEIGLVKDQYFVIATTTSQYTQYNTLQAVTSGIKLEITPYASSSGEITVNVKPEVGDVVGRGENDLPEINRRTASTTVRVNDGETFTIGGLSIQQESTTHKKVPFLGDIPVMGRLFRHEEKVVRDNQIVIFITPHILKG
jgi:type IV pilus assembly protein PilQ